jgi:hypothetical protein
MIRAHGRSVCVSQDTNRAAATSAPSDAKPASTMLAACAKPVSTASALVAVTQTRTSTSRPFHMAWANSTASCVLPVPPWVTGATSLSSPCTSTAASPACRLLARSGPVSARV